MTPVRSLGLAAAVALVCQIASPFHAKAEPKVLASIKPVHSLVSAVMQGVAEPEILVDGAGSPHNYSLKPSQARRLEKADLIFWIGHDLEAFLDKPLATLGKNALVVELSDSPGLLKLSQREGGSFEAHDDGDHSTHQDHEKHEADHEKHDEEHEKHEEHAKAGDHDTDDHEDGHHHGGVDLHYWLDPENAKVFVREIAAALTKIDAGNAETYKTNAEQTLARLDVLTQQLNTSLEPVRDRPFVVFHDAYHYFENRFGMNAAGAITVNPDTLPGAERVAEIQKTVRDLQAACVFSEPQFEPRIVSVVLEKSDAKAAVLDPLGASLDNGPELYFDLMNQMAAAFQTCLANPS